jgi:aldose sugar dehydrogenase
MIRLVLAAVAFLAGPAAAAAEGRHATSAGAVEVQRVISGLSVPWAIAFLPDGGYLVTERGGRMLHLRDGGYEVVEGVPAVWAQGQGGLLDVVAARDFASSREIFFTFAEPRGGNTAATALAVARLAEDGGRLENVRVIWRMGDATSSGQHFGSRIVEATDGTLFVTTGDRGERNAAQDLGSHKGKLIRVNRDGSIPSDNPFVGREGALPEIWSWGLRNLQGAALGPDGAVWTAMHGPRGGDEINVHAEAGLNYGWPVQSFGAEYRSGAQVGTAGPVAGMTEPLHWWSDPLDRHRRAFAAADADRGEAGRAVVPLERVEQRHQDARPGRADRVAERAGAAVHVQPIVRRAGHRHEGHRHHREGLVHLPEVDVVAGPAEPRHQRLRRRHRRGGEAARLLGVARMAEQAGAHRQAGGPGVGLAHQHECGRPVGDRRGVGRRHGAVLAEGGLQRRDLLGSGGARLLVLADRGVPDRVVTATGAISAAKVPEAWASRARVSEASA